jgi:hypothetical protein
MISHPNSVIAFELMRHQELQAENIQVRRALAAAAPRPAQPAVLRRARVWAGAVLVRLGTTLQAEAREPTAQRGAFPAGAA